MNIRKMREDLKYGKTIYDMPLKVSYYARVSTDKDDQLNSLDNQKKYFEEMIKENKNWIFSGEFIDEGISGTAVKNRDSFLKMIEEAKYGKIDLILTKEISRFSRNTVDSIKYTQYLLKCGVIVYFISDNLNTIAEDSEFRLTIMSSLAQDEVRKLSERVKFGINRMIKDRKLIGGNLTGYYKKNGMYEINEDEAFIIRYLFESYVTENISLKKIAENLAKKGYLNKKGEIYSQTTLVKFLTNPRYKGYYTAKLTEVEDYKTHKKKKVPKEKQIIEKDDKIPKIVSEELWDKCNLIYQKRKKSLSRHILNQEEIIKYSKYSCLIYCKHCGELFIRNGGSNRKKSPVWTCKTYRIKGISKCASPIIKESYLDEIFIDIFKSFFKDKNLFFNQVLTEYNNLLIKHTSSNNILDIKNQLALIDKKKDKLLDLNLKDIIDDLELKKRNDKLNMDKSLLNEKIKLLEKENNMFNLDNLKRSLDEKLDIKNQLVYLTKLLIEKIEIEKINNDRKNIRLFIYFNFNLNMIKKELRLI